MRKNIGYALAAIAGLALVGTACGVEVEPGAVGVGRMATSTSESQVAESQVVDFVDTEMQTLEIRWMSLDSPEKALICNVSDERGPHSAAAHIVEVSEGRFSQAEVEAFLIEKCM